MKIMQEALLDKIKADDIEDVYTAITELAAAWAIAGFITKSNELLETLWSFRLPHPENLRNIDYDFQIFWDKAAQYPDNIPFTLYDLFGTKRDKLTNLFHPLQLRDVTINEVRNKAWQELPVKYLWSKALSLAYNPSAKDFYSTKENQLEAIAAMEKYIASSPVDSSLLDSLVIVIVLSLKNRLIAKAKHYLTKWGEVYIKSTNILLSCSLIRQRRLTKLLLSKHLAPIMQLTEYNFDVGIMEIKAALAERIKNGRTLIYRHLSWRELLKEISAIALNQEDEMFDDDIKQSGWLGNKPATVKEIKQAEKRLGITLPKEYKDFLLTTNGFAATDYVGVTMAPVQSIDWLKNVDDSYLNWYDSISDDQKYQQLSKKFKSALYIGGFMEEQHVFLIPSDTQKNWECWFFAFWAPGESIYTNLRFYFENKLQFLKQYF